MNDKRPPAARLAAAERELSAAQGVLKRVLVEGRDTADARRSVAEAEHSRRLIESEVAEAAAQAEERAQAAISAAAVNITRQMGDGLAVMRAKLVVPAMPGRLG